MGIRRLNGSRGGSDALRTVMVIGLFCTFLNAESPGVFSFGAVVAALGPVIGPKGAGGVLPGTVFCSCGFWAAAAGGVDFTSPLKYGTGAWPAPPNSDGGIAVVTGGKL
jgi:hypothetical protein